MHAYDHSCYCADCCNHEDRLRRFSTEQAERKAHADAHRVQSEERRNLQVSLQLELVKGNV